MRALGKYQLVEEIGQGGMGKVWSAFDTTLERPVAVKCLSLDGLPEAKRLERSQRFLREARAAARLQHPNIVTIYDFGAEEGMPYLVMEKLEGRDLDQLLMLEVDAPLDVKLEWLLQALDGLTAAHAAGFVHRDIKPANLFLTDEGRIKILDFGVVDDHMANLRQDKGVHGTLVYLAPEVVKRQQASPATDLFAVGVVLYQLLTNQLPFDGDTFPEIMDAITSRPMPAVDWAGRGLPPAIENVLTTALAKAPPARYSSAAAMSAALREIRDSLGRDNAAVEAELQRGLSALKRGDEKSAREAFAEVLQRKPGHVEAARLLNRLPAVRPATPTAPDLPVGLPVELGPLAARVDHDPAAVLRALRAHLGTPEAAALYRRAAARLIEGRTQKRLGVEAAIAVGVAAASAGRYGEALNSFERALELDPAHQVARDNLAAVRAQLTGRGEPAPLHYAEAARAEPRRECSGEVLLRAADEPGAIPVMARLLEVSPSGIAVLSTRPFEPGRLAAIEVVSGPARFELDAQVMAVQAEPRHHRIGLSLLAIPPEWPAFAAGGD